MIRESSEKKSFSQIKIKELISFFFFEITLWFFLSFLLKYFSFIISFNLKTNLANRKGLNFYYIFGKCSLLLGEEKEPSWNKIIMIVSLIYFPSFIIVNLAKKYLIAYFERNIEIFFIKKIVNLHLDSLTQNNLDISSLREEKILSFSNFFFTTINFIFDNFLEIVFEVYYFFYLIFSRKTDGIISSFFFCFFINLLLKIIFDSFKNKNFKKAEKKRFLLLKKEKKKIIELLNKKEINKKRKSEIIDNLISLNSKKFMKFNFYSLVLDIPDLITSGINIFFIIFINQLKIIKNLSWTGYYFSNVIKKVFSRTKRLINSKRKVKEVILEYEKIVSEIK